MKRSSLNFFIDIIAFVGFVILTITGVLMRYVLPPGSGGFSTIWQLDRHEWGDIHFWVSVIFFAILSLHLLLHWRWIFSVIAGRSNERSGYRFGVGIVSFIAVIALALSPLFAPVEIDLSTKGKSAHKYKDSSIRGTMTFREVEELTGVPAKYIFRMMNLPESISAEQRIGSIKNKFAYEIKDIREVVKGYAENDKTK